MFTGIIEGMGRVISVFPIKDGKGLSLVLPFSKDVLSIGQSLSVNGACLTLESIDEEKGTFFLSKPTMRTTNLSALKPGDIVNLERPLRLNQGLGGHILTGHVDITSKILGIHKNILRISLPEEIAHFMVQKGSIAIDGVSLTIASLGTDYFLAGIIPHTWENTNLKYKRKGDMVNIEVDIISKYVWRILTSGHMQGFDYKAQLLTAEKLLAYGYLPEDKESL